MTTTSPSKAILVLGASRGLGREIALALSRIGICVGVGCRTGADADEVAHAITALGGRAVAAEVDVRDLAQVEAAVAATRAAFGRLDGVINNAGAIEPIAPIATTDPAQWANTISINLIGAYHGVRAALNALEKDGVIINISSGAAERPMEGWSAYCCAKAGLMMMTRMIHEEHGDRGIRDYGFRPGLVDTDMQAKIRQSGMNPVSRVPQTDLLPPRAPADAIAWLASSRPEDLAGKEVDIRDPHFQKRLKDAFS